MGIGGSICQNCAISYFAMYATDSQSPLLYGIMSGLWAIGLVVGGPVGSAFVQSSATTWRWAFFINLPFLGLAIICALTFVPGRPESNNLPLRDRLADIDILGIALQVATTVLFAIAATFSGPLRSYQKRPGHQVVPITIMARRHMIPLWVASGCAGATMIQTILAFGHVDVYIREHLEHHSARVISTFDQRFGTHLTRIEISRSAIEAQAFMVPQTQRSTVIEILATSYLIHGVRKALRFATQENPLRAPGHHRTEDDRLFIVRDEFVLQQERDSTTLSYPDGEDVLGSSSADTIGRICGEIREHRILL
ncbi:uncharacterized protein FRV6_16859 [Fusarium oxysporum]|uniref:Major facilitator superfamily (MFS) profile domain-containing protein n=1 Tax=Fusarium oxysporum TaxID=5507 RepID=A0A2H3U453_FUSOX|nr:uncharacterized protein FRV6_16859 [Fusarium oxysporum]